SRVDALVALAGLKDASLAEAIERGLKDQQPMLRREARRLLAERSPERGVRELALALEKDETTPAEFTPTQKMRATLEARQSALAVLARLKRPEAQAVLEAWLDRLLAKKVAPELQLDVLEAARSLTSRPALEKLKRYEAGRPTNDALAPFTETREGG